VGAAWVEHRARQKPMWRYSTGGAIRQHGGDTHPRGDQIHERHRDGRRAPPIPDAEGDQACVHGRGQGGGLPRERRPRPRIADSRVSGDRGRRAPPCCTRQALGGGDRAARGGSLFTLVQKVLREFRLTRKLRPAASSYGAARSFCPGHRSSWREGTCSCGAGPESDGPGYSGAGWADGVAIRAFRR